MTQTARDTGDFATPVGAILLAALSNTIVKCGLVVGMGAGLLRRRVAFLSAILVVAGGLLIWLN
jgi:uncharacterized membrane protein (DUF4010 family)